MEARARPGVAPRSFRRAPESPPHEAHKLPSQPSSEWETAMKPPPFELPR